MIDTKRLETDAAYWDELAIPSKANWAGVKNESLVGWSEYIMGNEGILNVEMIPRPTTPAASEIMSDDCLAAKIGEIGNQIHNLGCDKQNDEELSDRLGELAIALWDLAKHAPADSAAPEWDGEGLPPVGTMCEKAPHWHKCEIVAEHDGGLVVYDMHSLDYYKVGLGMNFRPIRTKEQRQRDELINILGRLNIEFHGDDGGGTFEVDVDPVADAILSRYNLEPKL